MDAHFSSHGQNTDKFVYYKFGWIGVRTRHLSTTRMCESEFFFRQFIDTNSYTRISLANAKFCIVAYTFWGEYCSSRILDHYSTWCSTPSSGQILNIFQISRPGRVICRSLLYYLINGLFYSDPLCSWNKMMTNETIFICYYVIMIQWYLYEISHV